VELATKSANTDEHEAEIIQAALSGVFVIAGLLVLCGVAFQALGISLFEKYSFSQYTVTLVAIVGLTHIRQVLKNVHRVYGNLFRIGASELLTAVLPLLAVLFFRDQVLVFALLGALTLSEILSVMILLLDAPFEVIFSLSPERLRHLFSIGIPLLVYNISFHLKMLAGRTIISAFYPVATMGYYSLANSITTATLLGLKAVSWVVYPDILSNTSSEITDREAARTVKKVNILYGTAVVLVVFGVILLLPLMFFVLPNYRPVEEVLGILLLSQAVTSLSFGYNCVAIARRRQMQVAKISWVAVIIVSSISLIAAVLKLHFLWIAVSILVGSFVFTALQVRLGFQALHQSKDLRNWWEVLPLGTMISIMISALGISLGYTTIGAVIGLIIFVVTNKGKIMKLWHFVWRGGFSGKSVT
jgi:O-antigen/teichoic acid export membrane protein